jgi:hypothetical protein
LNVLAARDQMLGQRALSGADVQYEIAGSRPGLFDDALGPRLSEAMPPLGAHGSAP